MNKIFGSLVICGVSGFSTITRADCPNPFPAQPTPENLRECFLEVSRLKTDIAALRSKEETGIPIGAVVAFRAAPNAPSTCPLGWAALAEVRGRVIVGAGPHTNRDEKGAPLTEHLPSANGGVETSTLTLRELPAHTHEFRGEPVTRGGRNPGPGRELAIGDPDANLGFYTPKGTIAPAGNGMSFSNMPPYFAMLYCVKEK